MLFFPLISGYLRHFSVFGVVLYPWSLFLSIFSKLWFMCWNVYSLNYIRIFLGNSEYRDGLKKGKFREPFNVFRESRTSFRSINDRQWVIYGIFLKDFIAPAIQVMNSTTNRFRPFLVFQGRIAAINHINPKWFGVISMKDLVITGFPDATGVNGYCGMKKGKPS